MTVVMDGRALADALTQRLKKSVAVLKAQNIAPTLAVIEVGTDLASQVYVKNKASRAQRLGVRLMNHFMPSNTTQQQLLALIERLNQEPTIDAILVQLPLPAQIDQQAVILAIDPVKDVDGFHPENVGRLWSGKPARVPATPLGIMSLLTHYHISVAKKKVVIVGRSNIVGRPLAALMLNADATVTMAHHQTQNLREITCGADILVVAAGQYHLISAADVKLGAVVIDVGMNRDPAGHLAGDVDYKAVAPKASFITPVPGGVGPMTIISLMAQVIQIAKERH